MMMEVVVSRAETLALRVRVWVISPAVARRGV